MNGTRTRNGMGWSTRLLVGLVLILAGAAAALWGLAHYQPAARFLGIAPAAQQPAVPTPKMVVTNPPGAILGTAQPQPAETARIAALEQRLAQVENATQR